MINCRASSELEMRCISFMSAPPMNAGAFPGTVSPPVRTTARSDLSGNRSLHLSTSCVSRGVLTMLSFLGFDILIVAMLHPGRYSSMSHLTVACSSLANVPYDRARLGGSLVWLEPRRADQGELLDVLIVLQSNGSVVSVVDVLRRKCEASNAALRINDVRAVSQTIISLLTVESTQRSKSSRRSPLSYRPEQVHPQRDQVASFRPGHRQQRTSPHQTCVSGSGHRFRILGGVHLPANAIQCELPVQLIPVPKGFPAETHAACPTSTSTVDERWTLA